jgi:hypothetical protein
MSICAELLNGFDLECDGAIYKKYFQQIVLVNRADVNEFAITSTILKNRIYFNLLEGKTGYLFRNTENGSVINAEFSKSLKDGIVYYDHRLEVPVIGVNEDSKSILKQLDKADYFAAIHFKDGTIEIHGFNYGLKTEPYTYTPQGTGGAILSLVSKYSEYDPPYVYVPSLDPNATGYDANAVIDFNNLFTNINPIFGGDFNDDFNDDFNNQTA